MHYISDQSRDYTSDFSEFLPRTPTPTPDIRCSVFVRVTVRCRVVQRVAVYCSVLQCVAVCCSVLPTCTQNAYSDRRHFAQACGCAYLSTNSTPHLLPAYACQVGCQRGVCILPVYILTTYTPANSTPDMLSATVCEVSESRIYSTAWYRVFTFSHPCICQDVSRVYLDGGAVLKIQKKYNLAMQ